MIAGGGQALLLLPASAESLGHSFMFPFPSGAYQMWKNDMAGQLIGSL
jgi:hypothetical protein